MEGARGVKRGHLEGAREPQVVARAWFGLGLGLGFGFGFGFGLGLGLGLALTPNTTRVTLNLLDGGGDDDAALRRELDCVEEQVEQHLHGVGGGRW